MTMFLLDGGGQVNLPARPLVVRLHGSGPVAEHRLVAAVAVGEPVAMHRPGLLLLPRINQTTTVRLLPRLGSELFAPQSLLTVIVGPDGNDPNADYVSISVDVSGLPLHELVRLEPQGSTVTVTALGRRLDAKLSPQAEAARDLARELLGVPYVEADRAVEVRVGVDTSPSMQPFAADGSMTALLEVLAGVASVVDPNGELEAVLCGRTTTPLPATPVDRFAETTVAAVARQPLATGARTSTLATNRDRTLTYLVSDGAPADLLRRADRPPHLIVLGDAGFADAGTLAGLDLSTVVAAAGSGSAAGLRWEHVELRGIVSSLLAGFHAGQQGAA